MEWGVRTDIGKTRENNEDYYFVDKKHHRIFIVADGMGGHNGGEIASKIAIESVSSRINEHLNDINDRTIDVKIIQNAIYEANEIIHQKSLLNKDLDGMGTTITMAIILGNKIYIGHIGDSRAYLLQNDKLIQLTQDHTLVSELVKNGSITETEAKSHPKRNVITKALGTDIKVEPDILYKEFHDDNIIILCTDGLTNAITNKEIESSFIDSDNIQETCDHLVNLSNIRGGYDNITILAIRLRRD